MGFWLLQVGAAIPSTPTELVANASGPTKFVLVVLAVMSLVSWALMAAKAVEFKRAEAAGRDFIQEFEGAHTLDEAAEISRRLPPSPHRAVMTRAIRFVTETTPALSPTSDRRARLSASQVEALRLVLDSESVAVRDRLGRFVPSLATIGSVSPLIGLLGTVLGIIESFIGIATKGSGNIGAVAPGIAEALIATAAALSVAIPAVFGYNIFAHRLNRFDGELDGFGSELIALMVREGRI
ncbi:MAG: MotA/TolQ/ExbB proton channel family protein [Gemmatimonadaceae bacterium]|nr:MotA/TolQ/ExbB proton channel family protein [Gemmatimonadaceae bacterium]MDQ3243981.1 MotA/TolQ/ExbB proton channel family protein [Gemmatimonadota bacterium]